MCGIIGYIGKQEAFPILLDGLKNLEYRGYDSAGILVSDGSSARVVRSVGRVANLEAKIGTDAKDLKGSVGIAHTRWATHGGVSERNAHPHADCAGDIHLAHNGIIENWKELRAKLEASGHRFVSETDTEVLAHLVESFRSRGETFPDAARLALQEVRGTYGVVMFDRREPRILIAARNFSPLILGVGKDEFVVASDATAILRLTNNVVYLKDGEIVALSPEGHRIVTVRNEPVTRSAERLDWDFKAAQKDGFPHFMLKEIRDEAEAVRNALRGRLKADEGRSVLGGLGSVGDKLRDVRRILIAACGTAYLAGRVGEYMLEEYAGIPVELDFGSEFRYRKPVFQDGDALLAISQSGETADTLASLFEAKERGIMTLGIVNAVGSTIARETDAGVYQHAGPEVGVASTKSFASQLAILALFTLFFGRKRGLSFVMGTRIAKELERIPSLLDRLWESRADVERLAAKYRNARNFFFLGRKYNFPVALEGALKLKEIAYVHAEGYGAGELKHGPIALIDREFPSFVIAPRDSVYEKMLSNIAEIRARGGPIIAIATEGDTGMREAADDVIYIPKTLEMLTPILAAFELHLFAYYMGVACGYDVDKPRNLAKSVTVE